MRCLLYAAGVDGSRGVEAGADDLTPRDEPAEDRAADQALQDRRRAVAADPARGRRRQPRHRRAGDRRAGRRERQRQDHHRPAAGPDLQAHQRARSTSRASRCRRSLAARTGCATAAWCRWCSRTRSARSTRCSASQHGVLRSAEAAPAGAVRRSSDSRRRPRVFEVVGLNPAAEILQRYPLRAERRPAAAGRLRPGAGHAAEADPGRRAGLDAGRVDPDRPAQPDGQAARRAGRVDPVHHPRHRQRPLRRRPADRDVRRPDRGDRPDRGRARPPRHPYTQLLLSAVPDPRAPAAASRPRPTAASRPGSSTPRPAAGSAGGARSPSTPARRSRRSWRN